MIKGLPSIIIIRSLSHQRIGHREATETGIIQVTESVRCNLRNQFLHHRRPRSPLRQHRRRRNGTGLEHFSAAAVEVGHGAGVGIGGAIAVVLPRGRESAGQGEGGSEESEEREEETERGHGEGDEKRFRQDRENLHS